ncbi:site-specific integrase [Massilia sp. 9096]|uniref:site-specific integrase n=1 Tax=Massilia sp. 9096 TaxID=1500894 RepID=UPI000566DE2A|nr:site-specific integrase [Massilia sp. 9096]
MPIRLPSHLHRNRCGILYFRIAIPADLRVHFGQAEVYRSLDTAKVIDAALSAQTLALSFKNLFRQLREDSMCATKKRSSNAVPKVGMIMELSLDEFRRPKGKITTEPGDTPAMVQSAVQAMAAMLNAPAERPIEVTPALAVSHASKLLSDYIEPYLSHVLTANKPTEKTLESYRAAIALFVDIVGDKPLSTLAVTDQNRFEDTISEIPTNRTKIAAARGLSIDDMVSLDVAKLSAQSAKNTAQRTNNFLKWAFRREGSKPPFELMGNVRITARSRKVQRRAFTDDELRTLFSPTTYAQGRQQSPYMYWLPLIGLHSGMRINEIAQLALADVGARDGIACFHVTDNGDGDETDGRREKRVKTDAGRRIVPVHDSLISLGLLDYLQTVRHAGRSVLFPELIGGRDGPGQAASKQFARYCNRVGLDDPALVFHSFRHGAVSRMRTAGIAKELSMVVVGHTPGDDVHDTYGDIKNDFSIADRKRAIDTLRYDGVLDYAGLKKLRSTLVDVREALARARSRVRTVNKPLV